MVNHKLIKRQVRIIFKLESDYDKFEMILFNDGQNVGKMNKYLSLLPLVMYISNDT